MALGSLNLKVKRSDFQRQIDEIGAKMQALDDVVMKYRNLKENLDQFVEPEDDTYQQWVDRIDANIDAAGRSRAALKTAHDTLQKTVEQMDDFGSLVKETVTSATEAASEVVKATITVAPLL